MTGRSSRSAVPRAPSTKDNVPLSSTEAALASIWDSEVSPSRPTPSQSPPSQPNTPPGMSGQVIGRRLATDGMWHRVTVVYSSLDGHVRLYLDGHEDARGKLQNAKGYYEPEGLTTRVGCGGDCSKYLTGFKGDICDPSYSAWAYTHQEVAADAHTALSASPSEAMSQPLPTVWEPENDPLSDTGEEGHVRPRRPRKMVNTCRKTRKKPVA